MILWLQKEKIHPSLHPFQPPSPTLRNAFLPPGSASSYFCGVSNHTKLKKMKTIRLLPTPRFRRYSVLTFAGILMLGLIALTGCDEDDDAVVVTEEDVVNVVAYALANTSYGLNQFVADLVETAEAAEGEACGAAFSSEYVEVDDVGLFTFRYESSTDYTISCDGSSGYDGLDLNFRSQGEYDAPEIFTEDSITVDARILQASADETVYVMDGDYRRVGESEAKYNSDLNSFTSTLVMTLTDIQFDTNTEDIFSGTAPFEITGMTFQDAQDFAYQGDITFQGGGLCTISIGGATYELDLETGEFIKIN